MVLFTASGLTTALLDQAGPARAELDGGGGGSGSCSPTVSLTSLTVSPTNALFTWSVSPAQTPSGVVFWLSAYPTNSSGIYNQSAGTQSPSGVDTARVLYLLPSKTYDYRITANCEGAYVHSATSQFTTPAYVPSTVSVYGPAVGGPMMTLAKLSGFVTNAAGQTPPATNDPDVSTVAVEVSCVNGWIPSGYAPENNSTQVLGNGSFSLYVPYPCQNSYYPRASNAYLVTLVDVSDSALPQSGSGASGCWYCSIEKFWTASTGWGGYWNESVRVPVPQFARFTLPVDQIGPLTPQVLQFSNAPGPGYTSISYSQTVSYGNELCLPFIYGSENGCRAWGWSATSSYSTSLDYGGGLEYLTQQMAAGTAYLNGSNRTWAVENLTNYGPYLSQGFYYPGEAGYVADPFSPNDTVPGQHLMLDGSGEPFSDIKVPAGYDYVYTIASTQGSVASWNLGITLEADIPLGDVATLQLSTELSFSQTTTNSVTSALSFSLSSPKGVTSCYDVYATGPSHDAAALVIGIYWWKYSTSHTSGGECKTPSS